MIVPVLTFVLFVCTILYLPIENQSDQCLSSSAVPLCSIPNLCHDMVSNFASLNFVEVSKTRPTWRLAMTAHVLVFLLILSFRRSVSSSCATTGPRPCSGFNATDVVFDPVRYLI